MSRNIDLCYNCEKQTATYGADGVDGYVVMLCPTCVAELQKVGHLPNVEVK